MEKSSATFMRTQNYYPLTNNPMVRTLDFENLNNEEEDHLPDVGDMIPESIESLKDKFYGEFVRDDGLMDKYCEGEPMADAILSFIKSQIESARQSERERILKEVSEIKRYTAVIRIGGQAFDEYVVPDKDLQVVLRSK